MVPSSVLLKLQAKERENVLVSVTQDHEVADIISKIKDIARYGKSEQRRITERLFGELQKLPKFGFVADQLRYILDNTPTGVALPLSGRRGLADRLPHMANIESLSQTLTGRDTLPLAFITRIKKFLGDNDTAEALRAIGILNKILETNERITKETLTALQTELSSIKGLQGIDDVTKKQIAAISLRGEAILLQLRGIGEERQRLSDQVDILQHQIAVAPRRDASREEASKEEAPKKEAPKKEASKERIIRSLNELESRAKQLQANLDHYKRDFSHVWRKILSAISFGLYSYDTGPNSLKNRQEHEAQILSTVQSLRQDIDRITDTTSAFVVNSSTRNPATKLECIDYLRVDKSDYYACLGIQKTANLEDIKRAYRNLALRFHPDKNREHASEASEAFRIFQTAYEVLSDPGKKATYDSTHRANISSIDKATQRVSDLATDLAKEEDSYRRRPKWETQRTSAPSDEEPKAKVSSPR